MMKLRFLLVGLAAYILFIVVNNSSFNDWIFNSGSTAAVLIASTMRAMLGYVFGMIIAGWAFAEYEKKRSGKKDLTLHDLEVELNGYDSKQIKHHD